MTGSLESRIKGAIFGVAVADALGGPVEFHRRGTFARVTDYQNNRNINLPPGILLQDAPADKTYYYYYSAWTVDTSMTLCLAQSLITSRTFDPVSQLQNYNAWLSNGYLSPFSRRFEIGTLTRRTLNFWSRHIPPKPQSDADTNTPTITPEELGSLQTELSQSYARSKFCGNGSLMRTVPIALFYYSSPREVIAAHAHAASQLTHPYSTNGEACAIYCILVAAILSHAASTNSPADAQISKSALFDILKSFNFTDPTLRSRFEVYAAVEDFAARDEKLISSSRYVINSLEAALWAFFSTNNWEEGCLAVVNLGDDADTVGVIYGGLAGAYYGLESIPTRWRENLIKKELVAKIADDLYQVTVERTQQASSDESASQ
ncbi:ADP-ribosylarginine hydrolase [Drechslerella dactyloides]|uniref:ADP-ribosylhydrolase ARH3 n=1 Tax=Drechslerella dactyloides TaxID=74499 RepID=A0AAD6NI06_DREDA|nr:ADP-ribosylarginine hydrolase [Drechslerella dactyloides]